MTASKSMSGKVVGRPTCQRHFEVRRTRRLAPCVLGVCLVMVLASLTIVASPAKASGAGPVVVCCPGGGGGGVAHSLVTVDIFENKCQVSVNGTQIKNGGGAYLPVGWNIPVHASSCASGYAFSQWITNMGVVHSNRSASATFVPASNPGYLVAVTNLTAPTNWGGYVAGGSGFTAVSGSFIAPTAAYYNDDPDFPFWGDPNGFGEWFGIGGFGSQAMWQAGVDYYYNGGGSTLTIKLFYETCPAQGTCAKPVYGPALPAMGDAVGVSLWLSGGNAYSSIYVNDYPDHFWWNQSGLR